MMMNDIHYCINFINTRIKEEEYDKLNIINIININMINNSFTKFYIFINYFYYVLLRILIRVFLERR